jgi:hypothetical protein
MYFLQMDVRIRPMVYIKAGRLLEHFPFLIEQEDLFHGIHLQQSKGNGKILYADA